MAGQRRIEGETDEGSRQGLQEGADRGKQR